MKGAIFLLALMCSALAAPIEEDDVLAEFKEGNRLFSAAIYKGLLAENTGNIIVSPFSVETVLSLTYEGAKGETASELVAGLSLPDTDEKIQNAFKSFLPKLKSNADDDLTFSTANKIYVGDDVEVDEGFASIAKSVYGSDVGNVNFAASASAANEINEWVEAQTNHKIQNLVDPNGIGENTHIILVNTLYFSGKWASSFAQFPLSKATFYANEDEGVEVDFMHQEEYLNFYENTELDAKFLELPLKGADVSLVVVLPNEVDGLSSLEENIGKVLEAQPLEKEGVSVDLPTFTIATQIEFVPILESLGVNTLFDVNADLSGISTTYEHLYISNVVQKAFINVTESGIEAAAATDVVGPTAVTDVTVDFKADHPFLYYIKEDGVVIFSGRFVQPTA